VATTFLKKTASAYSLKYVVTSTGGGATANISAAQVISDCAPGPLKAFLNAINSGGAGGAGGITWPSLGQGSIPQLSVIISSNLGDGIASADFNGPANIFEAAGTANVGGAVVEIRYWHSAVR
jgi:hypothetical protein